jgi:hypothetical protein
MFIVLNLIAIPIIEINQLLIDHYSTVSYRSGVIFSENENEAILVRIRSPYPIPDRWVLKCLRDENGTILAKLSENKMVERYPHIKAYFNHCPISEFKRASCWRR